MRKLSDMRTTKKVAKVKRKSASTSKPVSPSIRSTRVKKLDRLRAIAHGLPKCGKTWFAATMSKYWKDKKPLKDCCWVSADEEATAGFHEHDIELPYEIDIPWLLTPPREGEDKPYAKNILQALTIASKGVRECVYDHGCEIVVIDTLSAIDDKLGKYWDDHCPTSKGGKEHRFAMYRLLAHTHTRFYEDMMALPAHVIFLCHSKALIETDDRNQKNKQKEQATPGMYDLVPQITGKALLLYTKNMSLTVAVIATPKPGKRNEFERTILTANGNGMQANTRFQLSLDKVEKPDLRAIFDKIKANW